MTEPEISPAVHAPDHQVGDWTPRQIRGLKIAIAIMSVVLVIGFAVVIGRIIYLMQQVDKPQTQTQTQSNITATILTKPLSLISKAQIALPDGAVIDDISLSNNRLAMQYNEAGRRFVAILDLTTGKIISTISIGGARANP